MKAQKLTPQAQIYWAAYEYLLKDRDASFLAEVRNKPRSRQAADHAKAVVKFAEEPKNRETLEAYAKQLKLNIKCGGDKSAVPPEEFALTDV